MPVAKQTLEEAVLKGKTGPWTSKRGFVLTEGPTDHFEAWPMGTQPKPDYMTDRGMKIILIANPVPTKQDDGTLKDAWMIVDFTTKETYRVNVDGTSTVIAKNDAPMTYPAQEHQTRTFGTGSARTDRFTSRAASSYAYNDPWDDEDDDPHFVQAARDMKKQGSGWTARGPQGHYGAGYADSDITFPFPWYDRWDEGLMAPKREYVSQYRGGASTSGNLNVKATTTTTVTEPTITSRVENGMTIYSRNTPTGGTT